MSGNERLRYTCTIWRFQQKASETNRKKGKIIALAGERKKKLFSQCDKWTVVFYVFLAIENHSTKFNLRSLLVLFSIGGVLLSLIPKYGSPKKKIMRVFDWPKNEHDKHTNKSNKPTENKNSYDKIEKPKVMRWIVWPFMEWTQRTRSTNKQIEKSDSWQIWFFRCIQ